MKKVLLILMAGLMISAQAMAVTVEDVCGQFDGRVQFLKEYCNDWQSANHAFLSRDKMRLGGQSVWHDGQRGGVASANIFFNSAAAEFTDSGFG